MPGVVVITGGGGGMGLACAEALAEGHRLVLAEHSRERLDAALAELSAAGIEAEGRECDVADRESVAELAEYARARGPLAALVHTAGLSRSMDDGPRIMAVNLVGTALVLDGFLPLAGPGSVAVCVASIGGHRLGVRPFDHLLVDPSSDGFLARLEAELPLAGRAGAAYDLSKRGVVLLVERRAREWGRRGARLLSLSPGVVDTPMGRLEGDKGAKGLNEIAALGRIGAPREIASVVAFLCSDGASYMTGCDVVVDGGTLAGLAHHAGDDAAAAWNELRTEPV
jgi:NAD(P)-dependent dehydrogenase (short-subunit alcohol dehydrogenase family)